MRVLITGVAGFIGSHLAERLINGGYEVLGVDSFLDYYPKSIKENNLKGLLAQSGFEFIQGDIAELDLNGIIAGVDAVFHQAALAGVRASWGSRFGEYVNNNVLGTQLLLEASKDKGLKKFIYASSSSVYGDALDFPITENSPLRPVSPYGVTKLAGEHLASLYHSGYGVPTVSLRYFTVYGPRQRPDMAFHKFIRAVSCGDEIEIYGTGEQTRDFTFVSDAVEANLQALSACKTGEIYNIGGGSRIMLSDTIKIIEEVTGRTANIKYTDTQRGDAKHTFADISKAGNDLSYSPSVNIRDGISKHYDWLLENKELYDQIC
jgi:nucleoside-diphosphate-sugar epimerase